jgi:hypothetical protein
MSDASTGEPRLSETPDSTTRQVVASDWNRAEIEAMPAPARPRERLFSRKVMIAWALFAIAAYFGVQVAKRAVKASVRQAVETGTLRSATRTKDGMVIETPSGTRITIRRDIPGGPSITVDDHPPTVTRTTTRTTVTTPTTPAARTPPAAAPEAPPPIPPEPKKR